MKTKNYLKKAVLLILVSSTQFIMAQVPNYVPTNGLVGYWPFSGNANDASGNANNGTNNGATLTTDRFGNANSAYIYNGTSSYINVPNSTSLQFNGQITISTWFNASYIPVGASLSTSYIMSKGADGGTPYSWTSILDTNSLQLNIWNNSNLNNTVAIPNSQYPISLNTWYNVVYTFDGTNAKAYINGVLKSTVASTYTTFSNIYDLKFGRRHTSGLPYFFNGKLDDIGVWNRALSQQEISNMYNQITIYSPNCNAVSGSLTQGLVAYYPFCGNANDDSGHGNNGTVSGATLTTDRFGNANSAYSFNGTTNKINLPLQQNNITAYTVSAWYKTSIGGPILSGRGSANQVGLTLDIHNVGTGGTLNNGKARYIADGSLIELGKITNNTYIDNQWHHIIGVYSGATGAISGSQFSIYIDNILVAQSSQTTGSATAPINNGTNLLIGAHQVWPSGGYFTGILDDIGIWNRALTTQEVTQLYNQNQCFTNTTVMDTLVINVGQMSYTAPIAYANKITIFPNPASTQVNISFNNISDLNGGIIKIINSLGQQVATTPITATGTNTTMTLSTWGGAGLYFVQIVNPQGQIVDIKKILLQ